MKLQFVNLPNTTSLKSTASGEYYQHTGKNNLIVPRIPFQVMAGIDGTKFEKGITLLDFEWWKNPDMTREELIDLSLKNNPDVILTSMISTSNADSMDYFTSEIKKRSPETKIILGGQGVKTLGETVFNYVPNVDFAFSGRTNELPSLLEKMSSGEDVGKRLFSSSEGEVSFSPEVLYGDHKSLLSDIMETSKENGVLPTAILETYKGCPMACDFCAAKGPVEEKDSGKVIDELNYLHDKGFKQFYIVDLTFGINKRRTGQVLSGLEKIRKDDSDVGFRCVTRADIVDEDFARKIKSAGCYEVGVGIETSNPEILREMNKKTSGEAQANAIDILGKNDINAKYFLIEGYKGSSSETSRQTFDLLNKIEGRGFPYLIQPASSRDIMPHQEGFQEKVASGKLSRGNLNQLDFNTDGRDSDWNDDRTVRAMGYYMLAYPSTEITTKSNVKLQERLTMDLPLVTNQFAFEKVIGEIDSRNELDMDIVHYLNGCYTPKEISEKVADIHNIPLNLSLGQVNEVVEELRGQGHVDSFGKPNVNARYSEGDNNLSSNLPRMNSNFMAFSDGENQRWAYTPSGRDKTMRSGFYQNIPESISEFSVFARGKYSIEQISDKLYGSLKGSEDFRSKDESLESTKKIAQICRKEGLLG